MLNLTIEKNGDGESLLRIEGEATVEHGEELRDALLDGLNSNQVLRIDLAQTTAIDIFGIQLICSAHRSAVAWGKAMDFDGDPPEVAAHAFDAAGFARPQGCSACPDSKSCPLNWNL